MADNDGQKKKDEKTGPSTIDLTSGASILDIGATARGAYLGGGIFAGSTVDITGHGPVYAGTQPLTFATQAEILGATSVLGKNVVEMKINTVGDARNFMVGVNNVASVFSENSGLLKSIESASAIAMNHGRLMTEAMDRINIPSMTAGLHLATEFHLKANEIVKLSESVTTVLAYGKAIQTQFDSAIAGNVTLKNGMTALGDMAVTLGKTVENYNSPYIHSGIITSPYIFEPQKIKTKEIEKVLPEVKKDLPVKTTEAIEIIEYIQNSDTKNDDKVISNTIGDLKRAVKTILGFNAMFIKQTASISIGHIENFVGSMGSITDQAHVSIKQVNGFSQEKIIDLVSQIQKFLPEGELKIEEKENIETLAIELKEEISKEAPKQSKIKTALISLKTIFEGVAGNVIAQGIIVELAKLLSGH